MSYRVRLARLWPYFGVFFLALASMRLFTGEWLTRFNPLPRDSWTDAQTVAVLLLLGAMGWGCSLFGRRDDHAAPAETQKEAAPPSWKALLPAAFLSLAANLWFAFQGEGALVRWLWVASLVALGWPFLGRLRHWRPVWPGFAEFSLVLLVALAAFTVRVTDLSQLPLHVDNDVSIMGLHTRGMLERNDFRWIGMAATNHQNSEHQWLAIGMTLFGRDQFGMGLFSVLAGTATCVLVHLLGRLLFNRWVGLLAAAFLAFEPVHIHFSRIVFGPLTTFFLTLALLLLAVGMRGGRLWAFAGSGVGFGAALLAYYSGRIGPVLVLALLVFWWFNRRHFRQVGWSCWLWLIAAMGITFGPNLAFGLSGGDKLAGRGREVILWTERAWQHLDKKYEAGGNALTIIAEQFRRTFLAPFFYPDESTICYLSRPMVGGLVAVCLIVGIGFCLRRVKCWEGVLLLAWVGLVFLFGGMLTIDPPYWPHLNIAMPGLVLLAAVGAERLARRTILQAGRWALLAVPAALGLAILFSGIHQWEVYRTFANHHVGGRVLALRVLEKTPPTHRFYFVSKQILASHELFHFNVPHHRITNLTVEELKQNPPAITQPTSIFVFDDVDQSAVPFVAGHYPGASAKLYYSGWEAPVFHHFQLFPQGWIEDGDVYYRPPEPLWRSPGWMTLVFLAGAVLLFGWMCLWQELRGRKRGPRAAE